jgi:hypothetical protein
MALELNIHTFNTSGIEFIPIEEVMLNLRSIINSGKFLNLARFREDDFTRIRKLPFTFIIPLMLTLMKSSTDLELTKFFLDNFTPETTYTQQSFSEARHKIRWEAFQYLNQSVVNDFYKHGYQTWNGFRIFSVDGSKIQLPNGDPSLVEIFGTMGRGGTSPTAQASLLFDVLNNIILDAQIHPMNIGEREQAQLHINYLKNHSSKDKELIIFDRGYPSFEFIKELNDNGINYLMRVRQKFNTEIDSLPLGTFNIELTDGNNFLQTKVIKFKLSQNNKNNEEECIETLITNVFDKDLTIDDFKKLYFFRWPVETKYNLLKHKIQLENFSGLSELSIRQDFFINILFSNLVAIVQKKAQQEFDADYEEKMKTYNNLSNKEKAKTKQPVKYKSNSNYAIGALKQFIVAVLLSGKKLMIKLLDKLQTLVRRIKKPFIPGRQNSRDDPRKANFHFNKKANCY